MKKRIFKLLISLLGILSVLFAAISASATSVKDDSNIEVMCFVEFISSFFENPDEWHVIDIYGNDISKQYYDANVELYENKDFERLMEHSEGLVDSLVQSTNNSMDDISAYSDISRSTHLSFVCIVGDNWGGLVPPDSEVYVTLTGNYVVDRENRAIVGVSSTSPSVRLDGFGDIVSGDITFAISNVKRSSSFTGERATFKATFDIFVTAGNYDTKELCGNYTITIVGGVDGGEAIDYQPNDGSDRHYVYKN